MIDRLVVGSGSLSLQLVESLVDESGTVRVLTGDENRADVYGDDVSVVVGDPTTQAAFEGLDGADIVVVADDDPDVNLAAAETARRVFPESYIVGYTGFDAGSRADALAGVADSVIRPDRTVADYLLERVSDAGIRIRHLSRVLRDVDELAIVTHDNPDPDAIASAVALARIAETLGCSAEVCYYGDITHQENRAFVNLLSFDLTNFDPEDTLEDYDGVALVDHSRPGVNDGLPEDLSVDIVIDHHPPRAPVEARFVDLRSDVGATSTLLVDYLQQFGIAFEEDVATGLLFGIRIDTKEFTREVSPADFEAAAALVPAADLSTLERIESPSISPETFETIASAIQNRQQEGSVLLSCVGSVRDRDALAQAADRLLTLEDVNTTLVYGIQAGTIYVSARSRGMEIDLGEILRDAFDPIGSAGGHADMAGAQITLGVLEAVEEREESLREIVEAVIADRFLEALDAHTEQTVAGIYNPEYDAEEYLVPGETLDAEEDGEATGNGSDETVAEPSAGEDER